MLKACYFSASVERFSFAAMLIKIKEIAFIKSQGINLFRKKNYYYVFVYGKPFLQQEILPFTDDNICTSELYYFLYIIFRMEQHGLISRFPTISQ